ncbi:MAG: integrase [Verrucomicrobia bacterium]|nr:MAG: integrase [Verrucomicrobiota bacterium]
MRNGIELLLRHLATERGLSTNYQLSTRHSLECFSAWLKKATGTEAAADVRPEQLTQYLADRKSQGLAAASLKLEVVALRIFFRFLVGRAYIPEDPAQFLVIPKIERYLPETLNLSAMEQLLESVNETSPLGLRNRAMLELLYACGLRVSELCSLRLENLDLDAQFVRVTGKGDKTRLVPLGSKSKTALIQYLHSGRPQLVTAKTKAEVFLSTRGKKLTPQRPWQLIKQYAARLGMDANVYPHLFRHSFATHLLVNGADLRIIQELLGHADISTTQIYTQLDQTRLHTVHRKFHPRA